MKKLMILSFVAAMSVAGCSKKKADTNATPTTETKAADPAAAPTDKPADPCAGKTADPCAAPKK